MLLGTFHWLEHAGRARAGCLGHQLKPEAQARKAHPDSVFAMLTSIFPRPEHAERAGAGCLGRQLGPKAQARRARPDSIFAMLPDTFPVETQVPYF